MNRRAFTLIEIVVTLTLLAVGVVALAGSLAVAARAIADTRRHTEAVLAARNHLEALASGERPCSSEEREARQGAATTIRISLRPAGPIGTVRATVTAIVGTGDRAAQVTLTAVLPCT